MTCKYAGCIGLTSVSIPESVTSIGYGAFMNCSSLTSITIPSSVTSIDDWAFSSCSSLTSVIIPNGVTSIGEKAFEDCLCLTSITIPESVVSIGDYAFSGCYLTSIKVLREDPIDIPNTAFVNYKTATLYVPTVCKQAYAEAEVWKKFLKIRSYDCIEKEGLIFELNESTQTYALVDYTDDLEGDIVIPSEVNGLPVTSIGDYALCSRFTGFDFWGGSGKLTAIVIPEGIVSIGECAFVDNPIKSITIPESVTTIEGGAFEGCWLQSVYALRKEPTEISDSLFSFKFYPIGADIPDYSTITLYVPAGCRQAYANTKGWSKFEKIIDPAMRFTDEQGVVYELDESTQTYSVIGYTDDLKGEIKIASEVKGLPVTSIGEDTFRGCSGLTSVSIPESVTSIGDGAFSGCSGLTSISIPESVTSIGEFAFSGCSGLTSVSIPESVTSIGDGAFYQCSGLTSVMVESGNLVYDSRNGCNAIIETSSNTLIAGCSSTTIPNSVTSIGERAFSGCRRLTSVTIPESVTSIGDWAFAYCSDLTSITIPNSVTSIGYYAFYNCSGLTSITIPNSVTSIGESAFLECI